MTCPSALELARFDAQGRQGATAEHVKGCARCAVRLQEIDEARSELLGADPAAASLQAARVLMAAAQERKRAARWRWLRWLAPATLVPAAAMGLLLVSKDALRGPGAGPEPSGEAARVRAKGSLALEVYCKRGDEIFPVSDGDDFLAGDRLRFAYTKAEAGHLMVFSVDDAGRISPFYQDAMLAALPVGAGSRVMLPESIELDAHHGWERIYAVWSRDPLDESAVRGAVSRALSQAGGDVRRAGDLALEGVEQVTTLLRRP